MNIMWQTRGKQFSNLQMGCFDLKVFDSKLLKYWSIEVTNKTIWRCEDRLQTVCGSWTHLLESFFWTIIKLRVIWSEIRLLHHWKWFSMLYWESQFETYWNRIEAFRQNGASGNSKNDWLHLIKNVRSKHKANTNSRCNVYLFESTMLNQRVLL